MSTYETPLGIPRYDSVTLLYSCLENPMDRGAWQIIVHGVVKSWTRLREPGGPGIKSMPPSVETQS